MFIESVYDDFTPSKIKLYTATKYKTYKYTHDSSMRVWCLKLGSGFKMSLFMHLRI